MFENVVLAQKFADRVSSASISKTVRLRLLTAQNSKLEFFENIFKIWAKIYGV